MDYCKETPIIEASNIYCNACDRVYKIIRIKHECDQMKVPLRSRVNAHIHRSRLEDVYTGLHPTEDEQKDMKIVKCEECEKRQITQSMHMCPTCEYTGFYDCDDDELCPACKAPPPEQKKRIRSRKQTEVVAVTPPKSDMRINVTLNKIEFERFVSAGLYCFVKDKVLSSEEFSASIIKCFNFDKEGMTELSNFAADLFESYNVTWRFDSSLEQLYLMHSYHNLGPENKTDLHIEW